MFLSVFDIFKVSVGPSSSHTMGPMLAAKRFRDLVAAMPSASGASIECRLYGSLAYTGEGHGTHRAVLCGLLGMLPETYDRDTATAALTALAEVKTTRIGGHRISLDPAHAIIAERGKSLPGHPNGMQFRLLRGDPDLLSEIYYSVGGGFVLSEAELAADTQGVGRPTDVPFPFATASQMLAMSAQSGLSIAEMKRHNEALAHPGPLLDARLMTIWDVMNRCIDRGLTTGGTLPGGLNVRRRAAGIETRLRLHAPGNSMPLHSAVDWLSAYAMAVNEENADGGQVVTAPTNGAAGVIPAVIRY